MVFDSMCTPIGITLPKVILLCHSFVGYRHFSLKKSMVVQFMKNVVYIVMN